MALEKKYKISNLINVIYSRFDRCGLERIMGLLFCEEFINNYNKKSLFGSIYSYPNAFYYTYNDYQYDLENNNILPNQFVKVWTGR